MYSYKDMVDLNTTRFMNFTANSTRLAVEFCKEPTINEFPVDFVPFKDSPYARLIIHIAILVYLLIGISIVCDEYFIESLNRISKDLNLKEDIAGATFMAIGTSAPELFTSIIGVIVAKSDIGTGTIVGSAIFNILFITAVCALASKHVLKIDFYPISRDSFFYGISVISLLLILLDGVINWYESIVLIFIYIVYILVMFFNNNIESWIKKKLSRYSNRVNAQENINENQICTDQTEMNTIVNSENTLNVDENVNDIDNRADKLPTDGEPTLKTASNVQKVIKWTVKILKLIPVPLKLLFKFTIPNAADENSRFSRVPFYFVPFLISIVYVGVFTYVIVWMVVIIGNTLNIPDTVAGLTILAAGTSLPEVVSSIIIMRQGKGEMAISNSIGSNIFDILMCLGLPWMIETLAIQSFKSIKVYSDGILFSSILLLVSVVVLVVSFVVNKWKLNKKFGVLMLVLWTVVTVISCLFEYDFFGKFSLPICS